MIAERWGSLAVADHTSTRDLVANVLLYDRLIVPVMTAQADRNEREYWVSHEWDPDLQSKRVDQLRGLAIPRPWDAQRREIFKTRMAELQAERFDARNVQTQEAHAYQITRMILAQEAVVEKLPGVQRVDVVAAYNSASAAEKDFIISEAPDPLSAQALLLTRRLAIPDFADEEKALACAIELSWDGDFRKKRSDLFEWQETAIAKKWSAEEAVERVAAMSEAYNGDVERAARAVRWKFVLMVCGIGLGFATGGAAAAAGAATLSTIQFLMFDRKPAIEAGSTSAAAMFHDTETKLGVRL